MTDITHMRDVDLTGRRVLIREDLNVPVAQGEITNEARIKAALPSLQQALSRGASVIIMSHLGRPVEGSLEQRFSLAPVARRLSQLLGQGIPLIENWLDYPLEVQPGEAVLCENVRFIPGEKSNDPDLAKRMAALCDVYVMDAFGTAHRAQASTCGVGEYAPQACAGPLLTAELDALSQALAEPARPLVAVVGGAKVSTKLEVLSTLISNVDQLIVGGGIANTFIAAAGYPVGASLYEADLLPMANQLFTLAKERNAEIPLPIDVVVADKVAADAQGRCVPLTDVQATDLILDVGPQTSKQFAHAMGNAGTIVWNGPLGVFECAPFAAGTRALAQSIAQSKAFSIAGGGDTLAAIDNFNCADGISYISTGGGAFLEFLEGRTLPAVEMLKRRHAADNEP